MTPMNPTHAILAPASPALTEPNAPLQLEPVIDRSQRTAQRAYKVMIVDDDTTNLRMVQRLLQLQGYKRFIATADSREAAHLVRVERPDILLMDLVMPHFSGLDILLELQDDPAVQRIPVLMFSAVTERETKLEALQRGATDFLSKPVDPSELAARVRNILLCKDYQDQLERHSERLEVAVRERTAQLEASQQDIVRCLAKAAEFRDDDTGRHIHRVGKYARLIAQRLGMSPAQADLMEQAAQLHDVGKIGVPDSILLKPGKLSEAEFASMRQHCDFGEHILQGDAMEEGRLVRRHAEVGATILAGSDSPLLQLAREIALTHHEKWNGTGYPNGLRGEQIPLSGRVTAVADVFDALSSRRCYKEPYPLNKCFDILQQERGVHFDPQVVDVFCASREDVTEIHRTWADDPEPASLA